MSQWAGLPGSAGPWSGGQASSWATCVLAPNAGPMTLDGTNTWVIAAPDQRDVVVIDPGPDDLAHWSQLERQLAATDQRVAQILLTHGHLDHSAGAQLFADQTGSSVRALDPKHCLGSEGLVAGEVVVVGDIEMMVIPTPGHTADSLSFLLAADHSVLTGDTILGRGTTVVAHPDGVLADYLNSLERLGEAAIEYGLETVLPGHGPALRDPAEVVQAYLSHRHERLSQVAGSWRRLREESNGQVSPDSEETAWAVVRDVYADVPQTVWPAALLSVRAQLAYLRDLTN